MKAQKSKIFISPWKSGTTSLGEALRILGFNPSGWQSDLFSNIEFGRISAVNNIADRYSRFNSFVKNEGEMVKDKMTFIVEKAEGHDVFDDWPLGHEAIHPFIKKILFPDCKFIFLVRDKTAYYKSTYNWMRTHPDVYQNADIFLSNEKRAKKTLFEERAKWIKNYNRISRKFPGSVLFMKITEGWKPICSFLKLPIPSGKNFPYLNKS